MLDHLPRSDPKSWVCPNFHGAQQEQNRLEEDGLTKMTDTAGKKNTGVLEVHGAQQIGLSRSNSIMATRTSRQKNMDRIKYMRADDHESGVSKGDIAGSNNVLTPIDKYIEHLANLDRNTDICVVETVSDGSRSSLGSSSSEVPLDMQAIIRSCNKFEYSTGPKEMVIDALLPAPLRLSPKSVKKEEAIGREVVSPRDKDEAVVDQGAMRSKVEEDMQSASKKNRKTMANEQDAPSLNKQEQLVHQDLEDTTGWSETSTRSSIELSSSADPFGRYEYFDYEPLPTKPPSNPFLSPASMSESQAHTASLSSISNAPSPGSSRWGASPSPFPPPNKPLPALPRIAEGSALSHAIQVIRNRNSGSLQRNSTRGVPRSVPYVSQESQACKGPHQLVEQLLLSGAYGPVVPTSKVPQVSDIAHSPLSELEFADESHIHPAFRRATLRSLSPVEEADTQNEHPFMLQSYQHRRMISDSTEESMVSASKPHSNPPSSYLHSEPPSPTQPPSAHSDPFKSPRSGRSSLLEPVRNSTREAYRGLEMEGPDSKFILRNYVPAIRRSRSELEKYAAVQNELHGLEVVPKGTRAHEPLVMAKCELLNCGDIPNPYLSRMSLRQSSEQTYPMKQNSITKRRMSVNYDSRSSTYSPIASSPRRRSFGLEGIPERTETSSTITPYKSKRMNEIINLRNMEVERAAMEKDMTFARKPSLKAKLDKFVKSGKERLAKAMRKDSAGPTY